MPRPAPIDAQLSSSPTSTGPPTSSSLGFLPARSHVHAVQLERGCSCAWVASGGTLSDFGELVLVHRRSMDESKPSSGYSRQAWLDSIREGVDTASIEQPSLH